MKRGFSLLISLCNRNTLLAPPPSHGISRSLLSTSAVSTAMTGTDTLDIEWPANRVRDTFVKFFEEKNHVYWKSSPVVPVNDPTLLFANAGSLPPSFLFHGYYCYALLLTITRVTSQILVILRIEFAIEVLVILLPRNKISN